MDTLTTVEIDPPGRVRVSVIWLHGLGADARDFEPLVPELKLAADLGVRFVFPNAPVRPVTINSGMRMRAWYDLLAFDLTRGEDAVGVRDSERLLHDLIRQEHARGIPYERIILAGFSQGGAMVLHTGLRFPDKLGGILALSCYVLLSKSLEAERHPANQDTPIFIAHGDHDAIVPVALGRAAVQQLQALGYAPEWQEYPMGHEVCWDEILDIGRWLTRVAT